MTIVELYLLQIKSQVIATYALCGFSNPVTMGVIVGGLGTLIPEKKSIISEIVLKTWIAGCIACFMTACFAGEIFCLFYNLDLYSSDINQTDSPLKDHFSSFKTY